MQGLSSGWAWRCGMQVAALDRWLRLFLSSCCRTAGPVLCMAPALCPTQDLCMLPCPQIGFGSGFKCNSAVWRALRPVKQQHNSWAHVVGRESEAMDTILALGQQKVRQAAGGGGGWAGGGWRAEVIPACALSADQRSRAEGSSFWCSMHWQHIGARILWHFAPLSPLTRTPAHPPLALSRVGGQGGAEAGGPGARGHHRPHPRQRHHGPRLLL